MLADVDHFKKYNDRYGHLDGDDALKRVAAALGNVYVHPIISYRYGGEELAIVLAETDIAGARGIRASRRRERVTARAQTPHEDSPVGALNRFGRRLGLEPRAAGDPTGADLGRYADEALYRAKAAGRNRYVVAGAACRSGAISCGVRTSGGRNRRRRATR